MKDIVLYLKKVWDVLSTLTTTATPNVKHQRRKSPLFNLLWCVPEDFSECELFAQQDIRFFQEL